MLLFHFCHTNLMQCHNHKRSEFSVLELEIFFSNITQFLLWIINDGQSILSTYYDANISLDVNVTNDCRLLLLLPCVVSHFVILPFLVTFFTLAKVPTPSKIHFGQHKFVTLVSQRTSITAKIFCSCKMIQSHSLTFSLFLSLLQMQVLFSK